LAEVCSVPVFLVKYTLYLLRELAHGVQLQ